MDDLISRAAAIERIDEALARVFKEPCGELILRKVPSAQPTDADIQRMQNVEQAMLDKAFECGKQDAMQWIPCSERLPEEGERVLATHLGGVNPNNQVIEHIYQCGKFTCGWDMDMNVNSPTFGQRYMGDVIAWMPLPEPAKLGGD